MSNNTNVRILRAFANHWLDKAETDTKRSLRKLVEFGYCFSGSSKIRNFFHEARNIINNNKSQYFSLTRNLVKNVDRVRTTEFGIIFGFDGLVKGINGPLLHTAEKEHKYALASIIGGQGGENILNANSLTERTNELSCGGTALFFIFIDSIEIDCELLRDLTDSFPLRTFFILTDRTDLALACNTKNVMPILDLYGKDYTEVSAKLKNQKQLFGGFLSYNDNNADTIKSTEFLDKVSESGCLFLFLVADASATKSCREKMSSFGHMQKRKPTHPIFITDLFGDLDWLNASVTDKKKQ